MDATFDSPLADAGFDACTTPTVCHRPHTYIPIHSPQPNRSLQGPGACRKASLGKYIVRPVLCVISSMLTRAHGRCSE
jgi:hypothetical protein